MLIKTLKAALVENAADIEQAMGWEEQAQKNRENIQQKLFMELDDQEKIIVELMKQNGDISFDLLVQRVNVSFSKLSSLLLTLEFKGIISSLPGKMFRLN
jgi:DNA processing protein